MAFSDFTLEQVGKALGVTMREAELFPSPQLVSIPPWLRLTLDQRTQLALISEKSRSEFIVVPILLASRELSPVPLALFSGQRLDVEAGLGLVGKCDFILAATDPIPPLRTPIATIVEAKKRDIESGLSQMVATRMFDQIAQSNDTIHPAQKSN